MIRLDMAREAQWIDLGHGVETLCAPMTAAVLASARADSVVEDIATTEEPVEVKMLVLAAAVAMRVIKEWRGVGDDLGAPIPPSREAVLALFALPDVGEKFNSVYLAKWWVLDAEKKD